MTKFITKNGKHIPIDDKGKRDDSEKPEERKLDDKNREEELEEYVKDCE